MFLVLLCSAALVILPIFHVQYQRFLTSLSLTDSNRQLLSPPSDPRALHERKNVSLDGAASDSTSEGSSDPSPDRMAMTNKFDRRESRKPWDPPFPTRAKTLRAPYLVLGQAEEKRDITSEKIEGEEAKKSPTSRALPKEPHGLTDLGHMPVTDPPSYGTPILSPRSPINAKRPQTAMQTTPEAQAKPSESDPRPFQAAGIPRRLSLVQLVLLSLGSIIFIFAFAILVAHCMAWFVVYKTEARLGEVRKGLLRGGDMRVCLCAR